MLFTSKNTPKLAFVYQINHICLSYVRFYFSWGVIFAFPIWQVPAAQKAQRPLRGKFIKEGATQQQQVIALIQLADTADINPVELKS